MEQRAGYLDRERPKEGTIPDQAGIGITKPTAVQVEKPVKTLEELMASGKVRLGIPGSSAAPIEPEAGGTAAPAAGSEQPDGW